MLIKLLKYEIRSMKRILMPLYKALLILAVVFAVNVRVASSYRIDRFLKRYHLAAVSAFFERSTMALMVLFTGMLLAVSVVTIILVIKKFYGNLLSKEGYRMFTLPVRTTQLVMSKALAAAIWIFAGGMIGSVSAIFTVSVVNSVPEMFGQIRNLLTLLIEDQSAARAAGWIAMMMVTAFVYVMSLILKVYAAMTIGHEWTGHRRLGTILAYLFFTGVRESLRWTFHMGRGYSRLLSSITFGQAWTALLAVLIPALTGILIYWFITWYLLDRRLNL